MSQRRFLSLSVVVLASCGQVPTSAGPPDAAPAGDANGSGGGVVVDPPRFIFASSVDFPGQLGGLAGADSKCQTLAREAALPGTYKAWLADATASPATRMVHGTGPYRLPDGPVVATNWTDLTDGTLAAPINLDEDGFEIDESTACRGGELWSNVSPDGQRRPGLDCEGWTRGAGSMGSGGNLRNRDEMWTAGDCPNITCATLLPIYCVQQ